MKTAIQVSLLLFVLSVHGGEICTDEPPGFNICEDSGVLTNIKKTGDNKELLMLLDSDKTIGPNAFKDLDIEKVALKFQTNDKFNRSTFHNLNVGPESLIGLANLKILVIEAANISAKGNPLASLSKLERLILQTCDVDEVPTEMLASVPNLQELVIEENIITAVKQNAFADLKHLKILDLSKNGISTLESGCFNGLDELVVLDLSLNALKTVPAVFSGLNELKLLAINYGFELTGIEPNALKGMPSLTELELKFNGFTTLQPGMFDDVPKLLALRLDGNSIDKIPKNVFPKLTLLKELTLSSNNIKTIEPGTFSGLSLKTLLLGSNRDIGTIEPGIFNDISIENLDLMDCGISSIKPRALSGLRTIMVDLSDNKFTVIGSEDLSGLSAIFLDLSNNKIAEILPNAMKNTRVKTLIIGGNPVKIEDKEILGLPESVEINHE